RFKDRPLVLLGVNTVKPGKKVLNNGDKTRANAKAVADKLKMPVRSWNDVDGLLVARWEVDAVPWIFVLDHRGVIVKFYEGARRFHRIAASRPARTIPSPEPCHAPHRPPWDRPRRGPRDPQRPRRPGRREEGPEGRDHRPGHLARGRLRRHPEPSGRQAAVQRG